VTIVNMTSIEVADDNSLQIGKHIP